MKHYNYNNSFNKSFQNLIKMEQKILNSYFQNIISIQDTIINNSLQTLTSSMTHMINNIAYHQLMENTNYLSSIVVDTLSSQINHLTDIVYKNLLNSNYTTLQTLQEIFINYNIKDLNLDAIDINENGSISYDGETFTDNDIDISSSELLIKASTGTMDYSDIKKHPRLAISLIIVFYILLNLVLPDLYTSAKQYIKDNFFSNKSNVSEDDYANFRIVIVDVLNVRRDHSTESDIIGKLYYLNIVRVIETYPYWLKIEYIDSKNNIQITGWISKKYTSDFSKETENLFNLDNN